MQVLKLYSRNTPQKAAAVREGLRMVRGIMASDTSKDGLTTSQIYQIAVKKRPSPQFKSLLKQSKDSVVGVNVYGKSGNLKMSPPPPLNPLHPLKSMTFLKREVLPVLEGNKEITLKRVMRVPSIEQETKTQGNTKSKKGKTNEAPSPVQVYLWKTVSKPKNPSATTEVNWGPYAKSFKPQWWEVGVNEDSGHLNRRRQRARVEKIGREVELAKRVKWAATKEQRLEIEALKQARELKRKEGVDRWFAGVRIRMRQRARALNKVRREKAKAAKRAAKTGTSTA
ncbi:hypothetical protein WG66_003872 [Moniliophthora roreri]|uniref:Uncharacterized protein n=1 Tax=Moniliophthora roreri TaxID=221103 RepID=A0A0W0FMB0_MONRR|nr:hypothetical protein WG66_003872 [Moniliophthora roreri]